MIMIILFSVHNAAYDIFMCMCESERENHVTCLCKRTYLFNNAHRGAAWVPAFYRPAWENQLSIRNQRENQRVVKSPFWLPTCVGAASVALLPGLLKTFFLARFGFFFYKLGQQKKWIQHWNLTKPQQGFRDTLPESLHVRRLRMEPADWDKKPVLILKP